MGIIQNGYDQHGNAQDDLEFFICTHKASLPSKTQGGKTMAALLAAWVSVLYCQ